MIRAFFELIHLRLPLIGNGGNGYIHHVYYVHVVKALNEPHLSVLGTNL